jgi:hypothetical protein
LSRIETDTAGMEAARRVVGSRSAGGVCTAPDVAAALGVTQFRARGLFRALVERGLIQRAGRSDRYVAVTSVCPTCMRGFEHTVGDVQERASVGGVIGREEVTESSGHGVTECSGSERGGPRPPLGAAERSAEMCGEGRA